MQDFRLIALTPPGLVDPSVAIAASRAGALGVLDLQYADDRRAALSAVRRLARYAKGACGLKLDAWDEGLAEALLGELPDAVGTVILSPSDTLAERVEALRGRNLTVLLEATQLEHGLLGAELGVDGIIAKGHEAGGRVGEETSFILLQRMISCVPLPLWVHGGIGLHTAAACYAAGAAGVVLDAQLALTRESSLPDAVKAAVARADGGETICLGSQLGESYRFYVQPNFAAVEELRAIAERLGESASPPDDILSEWRREVRARVGWGSPERQAWPLGQDAAFAAPLARRFRTVGGVLEGVRRAVETHLTAASALKPLAEGSPLARSHATRYPVVQGPMTRVSDTKSFAYEVAKGGALPFLALALLRAPDVRRLLEETRQALGERPWGVGILGFVPLELRQEQLEVIREYKPSFALIAGGRPDQARSLESEGIPTYLHVPSPGLLKLFLEDGARRFVFEGRECGGHVGPRSSFVLWDSMTDVLLESLPEHDLKDCHLLFAGGVHDAVSASMVAAMTAPLVERGAKIGVLLGTAYLFTEEAVASGAIKEGFQEEALKCRRTVLLESRPGHATRCAATPFADAFAAEKQRLISSDLSAEEMHEALEGLNLGRLRIASKGVSRHPRYRQDPSAPKYVELSEEEQRAQGMYMIGQVATLRDAVCTIEELHRSVSVESTERLAARVESAAARAEPPTEERPCDVAIIGMSCLLPKARDLQTYWQNILNKVDAITEVPPERWDWKRHFDPDPQTRDKVYSKWGGFLEDVPFDPLLYGMPPASLPSIEPMQLLTLEVVRAALEDAGYADRPFKRQAASVILGVGGGVADLGQHYALRAGLPDFFDEVPAGVLSNLPEWTEDSFAGILLNVAAGRVANRFDLGGVNYTVDAACASSLAAVYLATRELEAGTSDMVIVGGADTVQNIFGYLCFSKTHALSPRGKCHTFDDGADGIAISEGLAVLVLKRLADAERDGDRIYAVIKSVAGSSDGRDKGLTAPRPEGQMLALERAYAKAGFSPATVGLIEAHGTGTAAGDQAEVETLKRVFERSGAARRSCAIGSVKSMIGHTKCTAGVAGLAKVALALHHKVLPPTLNVTRPNTKARFDESPFYINTELRPWVHGEAEHPRRAGVSAFGFGGTNFHTVLEEYTGDYLPTEAADAPAREWGSELLLWAGETRREILEAVQAVERALADGARPRLCDLAYTLWVEAAGRRGVRLAVVASSLEDLRRKLGTALESLSKADAPVTLSHPEGIYFSEQPLGGQGRLAFLFPGQGSQYPYMLGELAVLFPEVREQFERADSLLKGRYPRPLSSYVSPAPWFTPEEEAAARQNLLRTDIAQPALGAADTALFHLLQTFGVEPDMVAGHSYGEYVALHAAGACDEETLFRLSEARGRYIIEATKEQPGAMAAVGAGPDAIREVLRSVEGVWLANINAPRQTIISGTLRGIEEAAALLSARGIETRTLPVSCAFHSPLIAPARDRLAETLASVEWSSTQIEVFSNTTAAPYPRDVKEMAARLTEHLLQPVEFAREVEAMYDAGARLFVEVGPRNVLTNLVRQILGERPHLAVVSDVPGRGGLLQLQHALGQLAAHGVPLRLERLYRGRSPRRHNLGALVEETREKPLPATTWLVNGGHARPLRGGMRVPSSNLQTETNGSTAAASGGPTAFHEVSMPAPAEPTVPAISARLEASGVSRHASPSSQTLTHHVPTGNGASNISDARPQANGSAAPVNGDAVGHAMGEFQRLMNRFLETQQQVMLAYLTGATDGGAAPSESAAPVIHQQTESHAELTGPLNLSHALPVEVPAPAAVEQRAPATGPTPTQPTMPAQADKQTLGGEELQRLLLELVSEKTGYPVEILNLGVNLEAELGIDSIKRVEILGALERQTRLIGTEMERASRCKTLQELFDFLAGRRTQQPPRGAGSESLSPSPAGPAAGDHSGNGAAPRPVSGEVKSDEEARPPDAVNGRGEIREKLLQLVSERTGYPREMLALDLNIEAELGIDSIKRVEIIGAFQRAFLPPDGPKAHNLMEKLTGVRTLGGIADAFYASIHSSNGSQHAADGATAPERPAPEAEVEPRGEIQLPRFRLSYVEAPLAAGAARITTDGVFVITDDERGVAHALAAALGQHGVRAVLVRADGRKGLSEEADTNLFKADLADPEAAAEVLNLIRRRHGAIAGLVHLLPLRPGAKFDELDLAAWRGRLEQDVKSLFHLARALGHDLRRAADAGGGWLFGVTSMGGTFGVEPVPATSFAPSHGGVAGLVKTFAVEWPRVRCKVIDMEAGGPAAELARRVLDEVAAPVDEEVEVGYSGARRIALRLESAPLDGSGAARPALDPGAVVLITGGARGITAEVAHELAVRYRPTLLLAGRTPLPPPEEEAETAGLTSPQEMKATLIERARRAGGEVTPSRIEAAYRELCRGREIRDNLSALRRAGADVRYFQCDVCDETALAGLVREVYETYGRLDGVVHGAGTIEDKLLEDKPPDSFARVFDTKVSSAFVLARSLRLDTLKFFALFSSIAGRFGNRGQGDYVASNDVVNKLACYLDRRWPGRVVAFNWNPWKKGMASPEVQRQFIERGVRLISPEEGRAAFMSELERGGKGEAEVVFGDGPWRRLPAAGAVRHPPPETEARGAALPLVGGLAFSPAAGGAAEVTLVLDPARHLYLRDHKLDGRPVLPAAVALELMAEAAVRQWPGREVIGVNSFRVLRGIVLEDGAKPIRVTVRPEAQPDHERQELAAAVTISATPDEGVNYRATVLLGERLPAAPAYETTRLADLRPFPLSTAEAYARLLFHGPLLQGIASVAGISEQGMEATLVASDPRQALLGAGAGSWVIDPVVIDSAFQLSILWSRVNTDMTPLPAGFRSLRRFGPLTGREIFCDFRARASAGGHVLETSYAFVSPEGRLLALLEEMEFSCSQTLNRLGGQATGGDA